MLKIHFSKKYFQGILFIAVILYLSYKLLYENSFSEMTIIPQYIDSVKIVDTKFLVDKDSSIYFSIDDKDAFKIFRYKNDSISRQLSNLVNVFSPFFYKDRLGAIHDYNGNEEFLPTLKILNRYTNNKTLRFIISSPSGSFMIFQIHAETSIYLIDVLKKRKIFLVKGNLNSASFSLDEKSLIISINKKLYLYKIKEGELKEIFSEIKGKKLNPSLYKRDIFFVNNSKSEFYEIYKGDIKNVDVIPKVICRSSHDLRLPKYDGNFLYYIQIINNEYLLFRKKLVSSNSEQITQNGVVYNYEVLNDTNLVMIYSDFYTPSSLIMYNVKTKSFNNLTGHFINTHYSYSIFKPKSELSTSYLLKSNNNSLKAKGIILFIHPGLRNDFSPRWDSILMGLLANNYIIIAPNYPGSIGYGKTYNNSSLHAAVDDLFIWKDYLKIHYPSIPIYLLTSSSGNILLESMLNKGENCISASVSLFGLPELNKIQFIVPTLYVLGRNDPLVNYKERYSFLSSVKEKNKNIFIKSYINEGHWFRHVANVKDVLMEILKFFDKYD